MKRGKCIFFGLSAAIALALLPGVVIYAANLVPMTVSLVQQRSLHQRVFATVLRPTAEWVRAFQAREGRLPTKAEVQDYAAIQCPGWNPVLFPPNKGTTGIPGKDFVVYICVSDWALKYQSWDGQERKAWTD